MGLLKLLLAFFKVLLCSTIVSFKLVFYGNAIVAAKQLLETAWHGTAEEGLRLEERLQKSLMGTPNQKEAVLANFENRAPDFKDRD